MKSGIHPNYVSNAVITCTTCGTKHEFGTTNPNVEVAICSHCHPFYTGEQQKVVDTANKIKRFEDQKSKTDELKKKMEQIKKQREERKKSKVGVISISNEPRLTLRDLLKANQDSKKKK